MTSTPTVRRSVTPLHPAAAHPATARPAAAHPTAMHPAPDRPPRPARTAAAGRYRYDVAADRWWWSPEAYVVLGLPPVPPTADLLLRAVHRDDRARVRRALADSCSTGGPFALEHRVVRADGLERTVVLVGEPETAPDRGITALCGMLVDVTDGRPDQSPDEQLRALTTEVEQLRQAMASRATIEQAKGVLMLLTGCTDLVAFDLLAHISSHTHRKVRDVAGAIIDSASGSRPLPDDVRAILHDACPPGRPAG